MAHSDRQVFLDQLAAATIKPNQRYQHYKTKGIYVVDKLVVLEATEELAVAYYDEAFPQLTWIRPYTDFVAKVDTQTPRFSLLS